MEDIAELIDKLCVELRLSVEGGRAIWREAVSRAGS